MPSSIYIYPTTGLAGNRLSIGSIGGDFLDTDRDDYFPGPIIDPYLWYTYSTGSTKVSFNAGAIVELFSSGGGSLYDIVSNDFYVSGDITLDYEILSEFLADAPSNAMTYAGLEMKFNSGATFTVSRMIMPGVNGQQVQALNVVGGALVGAANVVTKVAKGKLRLIKHGSVVVALHDDQVLIHNIFHPDEAFTVRIFSTTNGQPAYIKTRYKSYKSGVGVLLGNTPALNKIVEKDERVVMYIPKSTQVGPVDVSVFNHTGSVGFAAGGFEYPLVLGSPLSSNGGITGNVQNDIVLR